MFGFVSLGVSFASLVISCAALYWSRMARIEAAGAVERSRYALESSRKHVGLPYDHKIVHDWELRTQFGFAPQIKDDWTRRKDSDGVASALHLQPRANVNSDTMSPKAAMTTVIQVCTVRPRNVICARSTPIDSSFLRHLRRLVFCAIPSLRIRGKEPFSNRSTDGGFADDCVCGSL